MCACVSICANECIHGDYIYIYIENTGWWYTLATVMYKSTWWCQVASDDLQKIRFFLHQPGSFPHQGQFMVIISSWYRWVGSFIGKHTLEITLLCVIPARHRTYILPYMSLLVVCRFFLTYYLTSCMLRDIFSDVLPDAVPGILSGRYNDVL